MLKWQYELSGVIPRGILDSSLIDHYWLNDFNKQQEIYTWNKQL